MKKTNRLIALALSLVMLFCLAACGSGASSTPGGSSAPSNPASSTPSDPAPASSTPSDSAVEYEKLTLRASIQSGENETQAKIWKVFQNYVEEKTNGAVTFDVYYSGSLCSSMEELDMIRNGSVDFIIPMHVLFANELLFLNMPGFIKGEPQDVLDFANYIYFENETTSAMIEEEAIANNVKYLNVNFSGSCAFVGNEDFSSLADMQGRKLGNTQSTQFVAAGMNIVTVEPTDMYEALSRGVCDFSQMAVDGIYALRWYEACKAMVLDGLTAYGNLFTMRRDLYDGMSDALKQVIDEAAALAGEEYFKLVQEQEQTMIDEIAASGCAVKEFSEEDAAAWAAIQLNTAFESQMTFAEAQGKAAECEVFQGIVRDYLSEHLGYTFE